MAIAVLAFPILEFSSSSSSNQALQDSLPPFSTMGRKDKTKQQKDDEKPAAEKNAGNAKGGKTEQAGKEEKQQKGGKKAKK
ncbi:hypothetical protein PI124_g3064 [Phytophthora idaei]|nr:hypothetical protein PI126_g2375 [Phytophthora idaei]KAG3252303.1 hypothetical protein PI124_g3064 [Phytophthora idaei]